MRRVISPSVVRLSRGPGTVQLGIDPRHAVVVGGLDARLERLLRGQDCEGGDVASALGGETLRDRDTDALLRVLEGAGLLVDPSALAVPPGVDPIEDARLAPDRASAALVRGGSDAGRAPVQRRSHAYVAVAGAGRVGAAVAVLLAAAGVGHLVVEDSAPLRPEDLRPGGQFAEVGTRRGRVAEDAVRRSVPTVRQDAPSPAARPDVVVVAPADGLGRAQASRLLAEGCPHLLALVVETTGVVGPLVLPGRSSCLRCHDLHRADRDPAWPRLLDQVEHGAAVARACDATLAAIVAAQAAQQVLAHLDGERSAALDATLETALPGGLTRRRTWRSHPACGCQWQAGHPGAPSSPSSTGAAS